MLIPEEELKMLYSKFPGELSEVAKKTHDLILSIINLRQKYKKSSLLPLYPFDTDYENLNRLLYCIEQEVLKLGKPSVISKDVHEFTENELREIYTDKSEFINLGLDEWENEGLFDFKKISLKNYSNAEIIDIKNIKKKK